MSKIILVFFAVCVGIGNASAQQYIIDSLKKELQLYPKADTDRVNLLNEISYQNIGINYYHAQQYGDHALELSERLSFKKGIAIAKNRLALCYWILGDGKLALEQALGAIAIAEKEKLSYILAETYRLLSVTYTDQLELQKAELYANKAEELCLLTKNWDVLPRVYVASGLIQVALKKYDSALSLFNKSLSIAKDHNNAYYLPVIYTNIGATYGLKKNSSSAELEYYYKALKLSREMENKYAEARVLSKLGSAFAKEKKYAEAEKYLQESQQISHAIGLKMVVKDNLMHLMNLKIQQGNSNEAYRYMKDYHGLKDSLSNEKKIRQIVELETHYEIDKKQKAIALLEQEKRIQRIWRDALLAGFIGIGIASFIIYRLLQLRAQRAKELLKVQKTLNDKLKETDLLKSRFFANISHEFRTPLSLIAAPIEEKLSSSSLSVHDKKTFQLVKRNTNRLLTLVTQLLDLSKLEVGKMQLHIRQGDLNEFLRILIATFDSLAESKKIYFSKNIHITTAETWYDADKLEKIINNLLFNAFKFTPAGGAVTLSIYSDKQSNEIQIRISDTGKGIPKEDLEHVFSPFYQSKNTADDGQLGTGLGLSLVKELVDLYGGTIDLVSFENKGTTVTLSVPISKERFPVDAFTAENHLSQENGSLYKENKHIEIKGEFDSDEIHAETVLIVEDNADLRNFLSSSLRSQFQTIMAKDGEEGFRLATEKVPDLIISDVMMPKLNGIELTAKLKADERTSHIPLVLLTARVDFESRMESLTLGVDDYLAKPFSTAELRVRIINLIEQRKKLAERFRKGIAELPKPTIEASLDEKFVHRAKTIVEANMSDYNFSVEKMAEEIHLSRTQLFRKLKAVTGLAPNEFINNIRLQKAAKLIRAKADTLSQISYSVGFNDQSYFAKRFRKKFGTSPSEYSNNAQ